MPRGRPKGSKNKAPTANTPALGAPDVISFENGSTIVLDDDAIDMGFDVPKEDLSKVKELPQNEPSEPLFETMSKHNPHHEVRAHAKLSASGSHIWMNCPGSIYLQAQCPEPGTSLHAAEGTLAHECADRILTTWLIDDVEITKAYAKNKDLFKDEEMADHILEYVLSVARLLAQRSAERVAVEKKFVLDENLEMFGTADFAFTYLTKDGNKRGIIVDLKYGQGVPVDAEDNSQLAFYACAMDQDPEWGPLEGVEVFIFQPRCEHEKGPLRSMKLNRKELDSWVEKLTAGAEFALTQAQCAEPVYNAGEHCRWCKASAICRAHLNLYTGDPQSDFTVLAQEPETYEIVGAVPEGKLVELVLNRAKIESFLQRVEDYVANQLKSGLVVRGLKLVSGRSSRKWMDNSEYVAEQLVSLGVTEPFERKLIGITKAEKIVGKGKLDGITESSEPSLKVVSESDPRAAVCINGNVPEEFAAIGSD